MPDATKRPALSVDVSKTFGSLGQISKIASIEEFNARKADLVQAVTDAKTAVTERDTQISSLSDANNTYQATVAELQAKSDSLQQQVTTQQRTIDRLNARLAAIAAAPPPVTPINLADSFRKVLDQVQSQARVRSATGPATTIKNMDIEVKGLVNVQEDGSTVMVLPTVATQIDASQLSTLRVSYAAVPGTGTATPPAITGVSPNRGPAAGGTAVTITGSGFTGAGAVLFGGSPPPSFSVVSDTQITTTSPSGSGTVDAVVLTAAGGASQTSQADQFTYIPAPKVASINPQSGPAAGGAVVTLTGSGFTGATAVVFGSAAASKVNVASDTQLTAVSPAGAAGITVDVVVSAPGGTSTTSPADQFTYTPPAPAVKEVNPRQGPASGGTAVTVTGANFVGVTAVTFGEIAANSFSVASDTQLSATSPKHAPGAVHVIVTNNGGNSAVTAADQFAYVAGVGPRRGPGPRAEAPTPKRRPKPRSAGGE